MGVDPGTIVTGWGVIARGATTARLVAAGVIRNRRDGSMPDRLLAIATVLRGVMDSHRPASVAVESTFYGKNAQSALKLGRARGVALLAAAERAIPTAEYSPREVKHSVVGRGGAGKEQVRSMVRDPLVEMSRLGLGLTAVVDDDRRVIGIFTDGDLRRALDRGIDVRAVRVDAVMIARPVTAAAELLAAEALALMQSRRINALPVVDEHGQLVGVFNMHDLLRAGVV